MKVLFSDVTYSYLFPGGKQVHAEKLFQNLTELGISVEYENWYNPHLKGDVIHFFGFNDFHKIQTLKKKGYKLVYTHIMDGLTNLPKSKQWYHKFKNQLIRLLPQKFNSLFPWKVLGEFDAIVYMHQNDLNTAVRLYNVDPSKACVIPHAVDSLEPFQGDVPSGNQKYLVSLGSIVERKNAVFTAEICKKNQIPIYFIGHPFDKNSAYFKRFTEFTDQQIVKYTGYVSESEKLSILKNACGFVLLSFGESGCISVYEAAAAGLPLLLSDLPWAKGYENPKDIQFCSPTNAADAEEKLISFYKHALRKNTTSFTVHTWKEIAGKYAEVYANVLKKN